MRHAVVLELSPGPVGLLHLRQPVPCSDRRIQTLGAMQLQETRQHPVHDLSGVEYHRLALRLAEMPGESAVGALNFELPVDNPLRAIDQLGTIEDPGCRDERLDDVSARLRIARKPPVFEAPARRHATGVGLAVAYVLGMAEPVDRRTQMVEMRVLGLRPANKIEGDQAGVARTPRLVAERSFPRRMASPAITLACAEAVH